MVLLVREEDVPRVAGLLNRDWLEMVETEGHELPSGAYSEDGEPPCPACGTAAPLVDGACSDCGLHLA